jgi:hypothetical protein
MRVNRDFRDLCAALHATGARFLLVGGYALGHYARPRFTRDLDLWVEATPENAQRVYAALLQFGAPADMFSERDFIEPKWTVQLGVAPNRIDLTTSIDGVAFADAWAAREQTEFMGETIPVIGRDHLIANKRAVGRLQDLADVELLERFRSDLNE